MIKCKNCKHFFIDRKGAGGCYKADEDPRNHSCIHAERADGLTECCATCRHLLDKREKRLCDKNIFRMRYDIAPLMEGNNYIDLNKMSCPEWQPREEKE